MNQRTPKTSLLVGNSTIIREFLPLFFWTGVVSPVRIDEGKPVQCRQVDKFISCLFLLQFYLSRARKVRGLRDGTFFACPPLIQEGASKRHTIDCQGCESVSQDAKNLEPSWAKWVPWRIGTNSFRIKIKKIRCGHVLPLKQGTFIVQTWRKSIQSAKIKRGFQLRRPSPRGNDYYLYCAILILHRIS